MQSLVRMSAPVAGALVSCAQPPLVRRHAAAGERRGKYRLGHTPLMIERRSAVGIRLRFRSSRPGPSPGQSARTRPPATAPPIAAARFFRSRPQRCASATEAGIEPAPTVIGGLALLTSVPLSRVSTAKRGRPERATCRIGS